MTSFNSFISDRWGFLGLSPNRSGSEAAWNMLMSLLDGSINHIYVKTFWSNHTAGPASPDDSDIGKVWIWNADSAFTGADHPWIAIQTEQGGSLARGAGFIWTAAGWRYIDFTDGGEGSAGKFQGLMAYCDNLISMSSDNAFGTTSATNDASHLYNRRGGQDEGIIAYAGYALGTQFGSAHGWQIVGGFKPEQPFGWTSHGVGVETGADITRFNEVMAGWWINSEAIRRLVWQITLPGVASTDVLSLNHAGRNLDALNAAVDLRIVLNDVSLPSTVLPAVGNGALEAYFNATNKTLILYQVATTISIGGSARTLASYDSIHVVAEYTGTI